MPAVTRRRTSGLAAASALSLLLVSPVAGAGTGDVGAMTGGDPYFPLDGNGGYDVRHYRVTNTYRPGTDRLRGRTLVRAVATQRLAGFHLDLVLRPDEVRVDGRPAEFSKPRRHELRVTPRDPIASGERFRVTVRYHGRPSRRTAEGMRPGWDLYFHERGETIAMGEPQNAAWWFPVNETPTDRATYSIGMRVPRGREVVSGGELVDRGATRRWELYRWAVDQPTVSYLVFFAAGEFAMRNGATADGTPALYAVSRDLGRAQRRQAFAFLRTTPRVLAWLERRVGPYPFDSTGGVVTALDSPYALETQTRPVYPFIGGRGGDNVLLVVHEQAHQWFGDDVTLQRWRDIWLNEGFATYAEWWWRASHGGLSTGEQLRRAYDALPADARFWEVPTLDPGADRMWGPSSYTRGAMTLAALRNRIGTAAHRELLREWATRHSGEGVTTADFTALAEEVSGEQLDAFFDAWLTATGRPADTAANGLG